MKYLKILGLAVIAAAALMAIVGAGTASAQSEEKAALCKVTPTAGICSVANTYPAGTEIHAVLAPGTIAVLTPKGEQVLVECEESTLAGKTETETTPTGPITALTWGKCQHNGIEEVKTVETGKLTVHHDTEPEGEHNGILTAEGVSVTVRGIFGGLHCDYGGIIKEGLTVTGGNPAKVDATATVELTGQTGFLECPESAVWHAEYEVTEPTPLYVGTHE
jgi:hypothetical protein